MSILYFLETIRSDFLNQFCIYMSQLGEETIVTLLGVIMLWCIDKKWGFRYFFMGCMSQAFCRLLKGTAQVKRPYEQDPDFSFVKAAEEKAPGYSMPSGHSQGAANAFGFYAIRFRRLMLSIIAVLLITLVMFSRMELGVHTLWDCLAGVCVAFAVMLFYTWLFNKADGRLSRLVFIVLASLAVMVFIIIFLYNVPQTDNFRPDVNLSCIKTTWSAFGTVVGLSIGYLIDRYFVKAQTKAPVWAQIIKVAAGLGLMLLVQKLLTSAFNSLLPDFLYTKAIVNGIILAVFTGIYPITFRIYPKRK